MSSYSVALLAACVFGVAAFGLSQAQPAPDAPPVPEAVQVDAARPADKNRRLNDGIGDQVSVTGFFRCLFEHSGIVQTKNSDCHIFEIHPVRAVTLGGNTFTFEVDSPAEEGIHDGWMRDARHRMIDHTMRGNTGNVRDIQDTIIIKQRAQSSTFGFSGITNWPFKNQEK